MAFESTVWTTIRDAGSGRTTAVSEVVARYRPAVVRFARGRGLDPADAEDVAQEVFLQLFSDRILARAEESQGKFRNLLLTVTRHVLGHHYERRDAQKRGGGQRPLSLDASGEVSLSDEALADPTSDPDFDREWFALLLTSALSKLEADNADYHRCLRAFLLEEKSHRAIAAELGKTEAMVRNSISRGKAKLAAILRAEIATYARTSRELDEELRFLATFVER